MLLIIGMCAAGIALIFSFIELVGFFRLWGQLNTYTHNQRGMASIEAYIKYPWRLITEVFPKATPLLIDAAIMFICGSIGLNGGVTAATVALVASSVASILVRVYRLWVHMFFPKSKQKEICQMTWEEYIQATQKKK